MKSTRFNPSIDIPRGWVVAFVSLAILLGPACDKKRRKKARSNQAESGTEMTNSSGQPMYNSQNAPTNALGMLPKDRTLWFEANDPEDILDQFNILGVGGMAHTLLGDDKDQAQQFLGSDITTKAGWRALGFALDRPMGFAVSFASYQDASTRKRPIVALYAHLNSPTALRNLINRTNRDDTMGPGTEAMQSLGADRYIWSQRDACLAINKNVGMLIFDSNHVQESKTATASPAVAVPNKKHIKNHYDKHDDHQREQDKPTEAAAVESNNHEKPRVPSKKTLSGAAQTCIQALNRASNESLASVPEVQEILDRDEAIRGYHTGEALQSILTALSRRFMGGSGSSVYARAQRVAAATVSSNDRMTYSGRVGKNTLSGSLALSSTGKTLIPNLIQNAEPPAWRGYLSQEPQLIAEVNLDMYALFSWWGRVSQALDIPNDEGTEMVRNSGLTGRLGLYLSIDENALRNNQPGGVELHVFAPVNDGQALNNLLKTLVKPSANIDGPLWSFPLLAGQKIWVGIRRNILMMTTDLDILKQASKAPEQPGWTLDSDANESGALLRFSPRLLGLFFMRNMTSMYTDMGSLPAPESGIKRPQMWAKLNKQEQQLRKKRKLREEQSAQSFINRFGVFELIGARTQDGARLNAQWKVNDKSWSSWMKKNVDITATNNREDALYWKQMQQIRQMRDSIQ